jgi:CRP/FNR family transcriptional regulator, dissimilatory nitrate respiration regulator
MLQNSSPVPDTLRALLPQALRGACESIDLARGAALFHAGRRPLHMHHVDEGEVALQRPGADGALLVLQRVQRGWVAEASLESERYHCDAVALAHSRITRLPRAALREALKADAAFAVRWVSMLNHELRRLRQQCERLSLNTVQARVLHLVETEGGPEGVPVGAGLKALAREIGVTHEALYRCLAQLQRRGLLQRVPGVPPLLRKPPAASLSRRG